jgi:hypothetical protein
MVYENASGAPSNQGDAQLWAQSYGHEGVVAYTSNTDDYWYPYGVDTGGGNFSIGLPGIMLVGTGNAIAKIGEPSAAEIQAALP